MSAARDAVREACRRQLGSYPRLPAYASMLRDAGLPEASAGQFFAAMMDAVLLSGDAEPVLALLHQLPDHGIDETIATVLQVGPQLEASIQPMLTMLGAAALEA